MDMRIRDGFVFCITQLDLYRQLKSFAGTLIDTLCT